MTCTREIIPETNQRSRTTYKSCRLNSRVETQLSSTLIRDKVSGSMHDYLTLAKPNNYNMEVCSQIKQEVCDSDIPYDDTRCEEDIDRGNVDQMDNNEFSHDNIKKEYIPFEQNICDKAHGENNVLYEEQNAENNSFTIFLPKIEQELPNNEDPTEGLSSNLSDDTDMKYKDINFIDLQTLDDSSTSGVIKTEPELETDEDEELEKGVVNTKRDNIKLIQRGMIIGLFLCGENVVEISNKLKLPRCTVRKWIKQYEEKGNEGLLGAPKSPVEKRKKITEKTDQEIAAECVNNPDLTAEAEDLNHLSAENRKNRPKKSEKRYIPFSKKWVPIETIRSRLRERTRPSIVED